jgi:hypothetical protein
MWEVEEEDDDDNEEIKGMAGKSPALVAAF